MEFVELRKQMHIPISIKYGLFFAAVTWLIVGLKSIEPTLFPVITDFEIEQYQHKDTGTEIQGTMFKARDCEFKEVVAYSGEYLVDVKFTETTEIVSRVEGHQAWGVWFIIPPVKQLALYARHDCAVTGKVTTKLFEGLLL